MNRSKTKTRAGGSRRSQKAPRRPRSFTPVSDALSQPFTFADTEISEGIQRHGLSGLLAAVMQAKRRPDAEPLNQVLCALLIWPLLKVVSIHCFCAELGQVLSGKVSVLYDFLGRGTSTGAVWPANWPGASFGRMNWARVPSAPSSIPLR